MPATPMTVLLTGASGFVGSHILDALRQQGIPTRILIRRSSSRRFIEHQLSSVTTCEGSIDEPDSLPRALQGVSHVIHCAGLVKALRVQDFHRINEVGTLNVVRAANAANVQRLIHVSSLAAAGPGTMDRPRGETDPAEPVSEYGRSKWAGEQAVRRQCEGDYVILRPPAVYGPRDQEFLRLFKAVKSGLIPDIGCNQQKLSLVYVEDLARVVVQCLHPTATARETFFVGHPDIESALSFGRQIATALGKRPLRVPIPTPLVWPLCLGQELLSRLTRSANVLSLQKYAELRAPGWVCDTTKLQKQLGLSCPTGLAEGVKRTLSAYRETGWL